MHNIPANQPTALDYLAEWLKDASSSTDKDSYNVMYQIAEGVHREVFPKRSLRAFARNYIIWDDSIPPQNSNPLYTYPTPEQQVREILSSSECDSWIFNSGQMQGSMHKEEIRRGLEGRDQHTTSILGVDLDERLQEIYSQGFDVGVNGWPVKERIEKSREKEVEKEVKETRTVEHLKSHHSKLNLGLLK